MGGMFFGHGDVLGHMSWMKSWLNQSWKSTKMESENSRSLTMIVTLCLYSCLSWIRASIPNWPHVHLCLPRFAPWDSTLQHDNHPARLLLGNATAHLHPCDGDMESIWSQMLKHDAACFFCFNNRYRIMWSFFLTSNGKSHNTALKDKHAVYIYIDCWWPWHKTELEKLRRT